jgi:hypothetical protein
MKSKIPNPNENIGGKALIRVSGFGHSFGFLVSGFWFYPTAFPHLGQNLAAAGNLAPQWPAMQK